MPTPDWNPLVVAFDAQEVSMPSREQALVGRKDELATLERLVAAVRGGRSAALVLRGGRGVGKTALLDRLAGGASGCRVVRASGVEGEADLPYAGLEQLCRPLVDAFRVLPQPQREALEAVLGLRSRARSDRQLLGLAVLTLLSEAAATRPLLCLVDDAQWLDRATRRALSFVAHRLGAGSVGLVVASREPVDGLEDLPQLQVAGLAPGDARVLLDSVLLGRVDGQVLEQFLVEAGGNPLALTALSRAITPGEAAAGILGLADGSRASRLDEAVRDRLDALPGDARRLLLLAAADPLGDPLLLLRAAAHDGLGVDAADAAEEAGLFELYPRAAFRDPLLRCAVYRSASNRERREAHAALAEVSDAEDALDRRAWHRAQATPVPDEDVAGELERAAGAARARGGLAAAAAFLERAAALTPDAASRAQRTLAAAEELFAAGAFDAAQAQLQAVDAARLDDLDQARGDLLHAELAVQLVGPGEEQVLRLLDAAARLADGAAPLAREAHVEALRAASQLSNPALFRAVLGVVDDRSGSETDGAAAEVLERWVETLQGRRADRADELREAVAALLDEPELQLLWAGQSATRLTWDLDGWDAVAGRAVEVARELGALGVLPGLLASWSDAKVATGELAAAAAALAEARAVGEATRARPEWPTAWLDAWRCDEVEALERLDAQEREAPGTAAFDHARALVHNAAGRYGDAFEAAERVGELDPLGLHTLALVELVEAAARCGDRDRASAAVDELVERMGPHASEWSLGLQVRCSALLSDDPSIAELLYREAIGRLGRTRARPELARTHLLYGEWLRREGRRSDAREQLRIAHDLFVAMGIPAFAERARRELAATGETARKRSAATRDDLTAQEAQIAHMAAQGLTNLEIAARLFLSARTVEWHLGRVYPKLGIRCRRELRSVLAGVSVPWSPLAAVRPAQGVTSTRPPRPARAASTASLTSSSG